MGSQETFQVKQKRIAKEIIYLEIAYWKECIMYSLDPKQKFSLLIFQLTNHPIFTFIERLKVNDPILFFGLSKDDVLNLNHEPSLPSPESLIQLFTLLTLPIGQDRNQIYSKVNQILLFSTSKQLRLTGLGLDRNFVEIFDEMKIMYQNYQLLCYYNILAKQVDKRELSS